MWRRCSTRKLEHLAPRHAREDSCVGDVCGADVIEVHAYVVMTVTCQTATILMKMTVIEVYGFGRLRLSPAAIDHVRFGPPLSGRYWATPSGPFVTCLATLYCLYAIQSCGVYLRFIV